MKTFPIAVVQARIQIGKSARLYCWPRQVFTPQPTTRNSSWFAMRNGISRRKKSSPRLSTGRIPSVRKTIGAAM